MERKLSTIFALDVVSFSKLMAIDEDITLAVLRQRREIIDQIIEDNNGRIFGSAGDSVIAEFASPVKATEASILIQSKMQLINVLTSNTPALPRGLPATREANRPKKPCPRPLFYSY